MKRTTIIMAKWLASGALLFSSFNAFADYKKGDVVNLTSNLQGIVLKDQQENSSSVSVEIRQNPDNKPSGVVEIKYLYTVNSQTFAVESMAKSAFYDNKEITSVTFNNASLTTIPSNAFGKCTKLTKCDLSNIRYISDQAFMDANALQEAIMPNVWNIGNQAFASCQSLTKVEVGPECRIIGGMAFGLCSNLKEAKLHYGLTEIGVNNFTGSLALADFVLPYTVTNIKKDLTATSTLSRLFLLSPSFKEWIKTTDQDGLPLGYSLLKHSGLNEIYCLDELVEDVNNLLSQYKGSLNFTTLEKAKSVSELVEIVPVIGEEGKFKVIKHDEDIKFIEVYKSNNIDRLYADNDGIFTASDSKAIIDYKVGNSPLRYLVTIDNTPPRPTFPVTDEQVIKMHGNIFTGSYDWTTTPMTKEADGNWTIKDVTVKSGEFGIQIFADANATTSTWINAEGDPAVVLDSELQGVDEGGKNWTITKGTYTFTFDPLYRALTVTGTPDISADPAPVWKYALHGNIENGETWKDIDLTDNEGIWSVTLEDIKGGEFGINSYDTANEKKGSWASAEKDKGDVVFGQPMAVVTSDNENWTIPAGSYTFTYNPAVQTLTVDKVVEPEPEPTPEPEPEIDYYLVGALPGWEPSEDYKFTKEENGEYTFEIEKLTGEFKITDGDKATWYGANKDEAIELDKAYTCNTDNGDNFSFSEPVLNAKFTFDPETKTLSITGTLQEVEHDYVYTLCGALTDDGKWEEYPMTLEDGRWTLTLDNGLVAFQIREYDNAVDPDVVTNYIKANTEGIIDQNGTYPATKKGGNDWSSELDGKCTYIFNPEKMILTVTGTTGVSSIEAEEGEAIYFNLQGQRIACPEKGVYIRVINGKADKIVK